MFAKVLIIGELALELLHESTEIANPFAHRSHMDMIAGDAEAPKRNAMLTSRISKPRAALGSVEPAFQQEIAVVASVSRVINVARKDVSVGRCGVEVPPRYEMS
jgi:hypothetical protein